MDAIDFIFVQLRCLLVIKWYCRSV